MQAEWCDECMGGKTKLCPTCHEGYICPECEEECLRCQLWPVEGQPRAGMDAGAEDPVRKILRLCGRCCDDGDHCEC